MILIAPPQGSSSPLLSTEHIMSVIDEHAESTALILLPGIQFYSGQYFDVQRITAHAHSKGLLIGWDCAHAAGNVPLRLHDWDVDFAVWCNYKYLNSGPGSIATIFVHEKHGEVDMNASGSAPRYRPRLTGWWGDDKSTRFQMANKFVPRPGAAGYQLSNPSALDLSSALSSLEIFGEAGIERLRKKSLKLTAYLESSLKAQTDVKVFTIITSSSSEERGAQLSVKLAEGLLDTVLEVLANNAIVVDERKPDVIRVAPTPLYNTFQDVRRFCQIFKTACSKAVATKANGKPNSSQASGVQPHPDV